MVLFQHTADTTSTVLAYLRSCQHQTLGVPMPALLAARSNTLDQVTEMVKCALMR